MADGEEPGAPYPAVVRDAVTNWFTDRVTEAEVALARALRQAEVLRERRAACRDGARLTDEEARQVAEGAEQRAARIAAATDARPEAHAGAVTAALAVREGLRSAGHPV
ncbi:hypothetical protein BX265_5262 [Streptomyces sp. TLI_235]|nr:hypothetical protein [Streptomyces sp. TLI_235]PBC70708.1 hypothetical protein BX265_5262 [Streptomyces sp. TLI_235]